MATKHGSNERKSKKAVRGGGTVKARLEFIDLGDREAPELRLAVRGPDGKKKELKADAAGAYALPKNLVGKGARLEIRSKTGEDVRSFRYDGFVESVAATGVYEFGEVVWGRWLKVRHCVSGRVRVCRPYQYLTTLASAEFAFANLAADSVAQAYRANLGRVLSDRGILGGAYELTPQFPVRCEPVCHGRVEVFVRTCCCPTLTLVDPPYVLVELCKIIDCYPKEIEWIPPEEMVEPGPFPGPRPDPIAKLQMATVRALERAETDEAAPAKERVLWAATHLSELVALPTAEAQMQYIESHADLACICCGCSVRKVAEVPLEPDGSFDACFYLSALVRHGCRRRVQYKVTQFQEEGAVVVYDGLATGERFRLSEFAELDANWKAESCDDTEFDPEAEPFVLLERTGSTWADNLIFTGKAAGIDPQDGTASYGPLMPADGLVNSAEQPWAKTLRLRFQFHPNLAGLGATKYRVRVFRVNNSGNATGYVKTLTNGISWRKYYDKGGGVPGVKWISLNEPGGYYKIPYPGQQLAVARRAVPRHDRHDGPRRQRPVSVCGRHLRCRRPSPDPQHRVADGNAHGAQAELRLLPSQGSFDGSDPGPDRGRPQGAGQSLPGQQHRMHRPDPRDRPQRQYEHRRLPVPDRPGDGPGADQVHREARQRLPVLALGAGQERPVRRLAVLRSLGSAGEPDDQ